MKYHRTLLSFHIQNRSVQLVARPNHARNVIYPFRAFTISCNKLHATHDIVNYTSKLIIRTLAGYNKQSAVKFHCTLLSFHIQNRSVQLVARPNHARNVISPFRAFTISCNKLHATHKIVNYASKLIIRATSCTLRMTS